jgi:CheY-like chemotaxis protein
VVEEHEKAKALGVVGYLVKPVSLSDLQTALHRGTEPAANRPEPSTPVIAAGEASPTGPVILLADDSEIVLSTLSDFLRAQAYQVVVVHHGGEVLEKARQVRPAVILMDIQMPVLDGLEAIRRLRAEADAGLAGTPIIALTALVMSGDLQRCLAAGANAYVPKPVNLERLMKIIRTYLKGDASQR